MEMPVKMVYVAGPYRGASEYDVLQNIRRAEAVAVRVWMAGAACICPHKNTAFLGGSVADSVWLEGDLEMVRRSDAIVCVEHWESSAGARGEVALARALGLPVFVALSEFEQWVSQGR